MAEVPVALITPTPQTITLDGVRCRVWSAILPDKTPFMLAVHRTAMEPEHEAAVLRAFPVLVPRPNVQKFGEVSSWRGPCLKKLREAVLRAQNDLCRHVAHSDEQSEHLTAALAAVEIACDELGGLPPMGAVGEFVTFEECKPAPCPCRECSTTEAPRG